MRRILDTVTVIAICSVITITLNHNTELTPAQPLPINLDSVTTQILDPLAITFSTLPSSLKKEVRCLAHNIYFEGRSESVIGQLAIAHVTLNRVESPLFPPNVCDVVRERNTRTCQFSWWCDSRLRSASLNNTLAEKQVYYQIKQLATEFMQQQPSRHDFTDGALFYHATYVNKRRIGVRGLIKTGTFGQHIFYRINT